jgi:hypothetical protein
LDISLETLLQRLVSRGTDVARQTPLKTEERLPTSIRLNPKTRHFLDTQADALNTSVQSVIGMILDGVAETTLSDTNGKLRTLRERFFFLMQAHGLDLPDVVDVMHEHGFTLSALGSAERLSDLLTKSTLKHVAETFGVEPEWLSAAGDSSVSARGWYKNTYGLAREIIDYQKADLKPEVLLLRRQNADFDRAAAVPDSENAEEEPIGIAVRLWRTTRSGKVFKTYKIWRFETWAYSKCRNEIKEFIAFCEHTRTAVSGRELPMEQIAALRQGRQLPITIIESPQFLGKTWYPEDYASFQFEVKKETHEWQYAREGYLRGLHRVACAEGGAAPLDERAKPSA